MSNPTPAPRQSAFPWWVVVLAVILGYLSWDAVVRVRQRLQVTGSYGVLVDPPRPEALSPTGYEHGRRSLILPDRSMDGYHWIMQTQAMVAAGEWRLRSVAYDNPPAGRAVHWAAPFHWWLIFLAGIEHFVSGQSWGVAIEHSALISGPVLLGLLLLGVTPLLAVRFAPAAAALFAFGSVAALPFAIDFQAGYPDHHGLVHACALLGVLFMLVAAGAGDGRKEGDLATARRWVIASAVAAGLGLWVSAATLVPVLVGLGLGGLVAAWLGRLPGQQNIWTRYPQLFRVWGGTGAVVSLTAYLVEYFPGDMGMRLEVNHPLYALAWLGGGEALCRFARLMTSPSVQASRRDKLAAAGALAAVAVAPVTLYLTRDTHFVLADQFLWRLHHEFIAEFQSLPAFLARGKYSVATIAPCLPLLLLVPAAWLALRPAGLRPARSRLVLALLPAGCILPLLLSQVRWWSLELALLVPVAAEIFRTFRHDFPAARRLMGVALIGGALLYLPGATLALRQGMAADLEIDDIRALAERDAAHWLRQRAGDGKVVIAGSPTVTTAMLFHGGLHGVGTLYWENIAGLKSAATLYAAATDAAAYEEVRRCGITHLVVVSWDGFEGAYTRLSRGLAVTAPLPPDAFIVRLLTAPVPPAWLRLIPFSLPRHPALDGQQMRIYAVTTPQSPVESLVHAATYALETAADPTPFVSALEAQPDSLLAATMRAEIASRRNEPQVFARAAGRVLALLPEAGALPLEDHVRTVAVLATAQQYDPARRELQQCLLKFTEADLRLLSAETLTRLLRLSQAAQIPWPDPGLRELAVQLLPPNMRE